MDTSQKYVSELMNALTVCRMILYEKKNGVNLIISTNIKKYIVLRYTNVYLI